MDIPVELARIIISETSPQQIIQLRETGGQRSFPIVIGISEAMAIDRRLKGLEMPRPMTHDLLATVIESLGARLERIVITDLHDHTFFATLHLRQDDEAIEIDARPSDAIALGAALGTPLFVAEQVFAAVMKDATDLSSQREAILARRDELVDLIDALRRQLRSDSFRKDLAADDLRTLQQQLEDMEGELEAIEEILRQLE